MPGMKIETYGREGSEELDYRTEGSEEFDYDDEVDYEEDGEVIEKITRLEKENEELKEELKKTMEKKKKLLIENGEWIEKNARLEKENEEVKEKLKKKIAEKKKKLMEKLGERTETIARLTEEIARNNAEIALLSDLGYFPEGIPRIDDEELARLKDDTARKRSELGFLLRYDPPEKEEMFMRAMKDCILRKQQEIKCTGSEYAKANGNVSCLEHPFFHGAYYFCSHA